MIYILNAVLKFSSTSFVFIYFCSNVAFRSDKQNLSPFIFVQSQLKLILCWPEIQLRSSTHKTMLNNFQPNFHLSKIYNSVIQSKRIDFIFVTCVCSIICVFAFQARKKCNLIDIIRHRLHHYMCFIYLHNVGI